LSKLTRSGMDDGHGRNHTTIRALEFALVVVRVPIRSTHGCYQSRAELRAVHAHRLRRARSTDAGNGLKLTNLTKGARKICARIGAVRLASRSIDLAGLVVTADFVGAWVDTRRDGWARSKNTNIL